ncbi:MarR family winged helix-turn-helix transcriptional regulator [Vibrio aestuarianus]|uniref:Organic hydroperoxide resistance transcriptional regulator n=1 Tax=Vibrio aestuarianus TaxID=28171 RepID=A0ABM9FJQ5_9VIBR|nr:MarR family transcriptional regulator [Vibrio aestuarianus]MDE1214787.1 MarR family transcriptional regulator [Vibrio aestuarianus]MDE1218404.1 MarR family transcriptional regulator [Vibrio aestuarianus]MDE1228837.1 MarR family transcriptional regulator [Vibrio aestuarianus]MDE1258862.1 MarR family transcriptional regulator [Vibrio aestuarianus]MDE1261910.1 MarR family transcriptional regulator [Vibrio aestuarianus]
MDKSAQDEYLSLDNQVCFALYSASNAMGRAYQPLLKALDLTYLQYIVMMVLWEEQSINVKQLGRRIHLDSGTLTPLLKRLETKGYVSRTRSQEDERIRIISVTEQGTELREKAKTIPVEMMGMSKMNIEELIKLKSDCEKLLANLTA